MHRAILFTVMSLCLAVPGIARAQDRSKVEIDASEVHAVRSEHLNRTIRLSVGLPLGRPPATGHYPVLYLLDGDLAFPLVRQIALSLQFAGELPPVLIVGIGYEGGLRSAMRWRSLDYTPTADEAYNEYARRWEGAPDDAQVTGGAQAYLDFIEHELKPYIEATFPADPNDSAIFGASFGGLFAAVALLERPALFQRYIMSSPSLWWHSNYIFDQEAALAKTRQLPRARVFFAVGGRENRDYEELMLEKATGPIRASMLDFRKLMGDDVDMIETMQLFADRLRSRHYADVKIDTRIFPDATHASTPPMTLAQGLRVVFETF